MSARVYRTASEEDTIELGRQACHANSCGRALVFLTGNLGAGKTTLTKGIVSGLGASDRRRGVEPNLYRHPRIRQRRVSHRSLSAGAGGGGGSMLGLDEMFDRGAVMLVEWGEAYKHVLPCSRLWRFESS